MAFAIGLIVMIIIFGILTKGFKGSFGPIKQRKTWENDDDLLNKSNDTASTFGSDDYSQSYNDALNHQINSNHMHTHSHSFSDSLHHHSDTHGHSESSSSHDHSWSHSSDTDSTSYDSGSSSYSQD